MAGNVRRWVFIGFIIAAPLALALWIACLPRLQSAFAAARGDSPPPLPPSKSGSALLTWTAPVANSDGSPIKGLAGYRVYVGAYPNALALRASVHGAQSTRFEVDKLAIPGTYYFAVTAYNDFGGESVPSSLGSKSF